MQSVERKEYSISEMQEIFIPGCNEFLQDRPKDEMGGEWCLITIDIDHFRLFSELYGREVGDAALQNIYEYLRGEGERTEIFSVYLGRDDFLVFTRYSEEVLKQIYDKVRSIILEGRTSVGFKPILGVCRIKDRAVEYADFDKAISAMVSVKQSHEPDSGGRYIGIFDEEDGESERKEYSTLLYLNEAFAKGLATFYLQPQVRISTGKIVGAEALARVFYEDGRTIYPAEFITALEKHGFIADFDIRIWEQVCAFLRGLIDKGVQPVPISINVSQMDLITMDVVETLKALCRKYMIPSYLLKVEITESVYAEKEELVRDVVDRLRKEGFLTFMDDFGTGYSSLHMLEDINADVIKLDMIFIRKKNFGSRKGVSILESVVNMAKIVGIPMVVEGIETREQLELIQSLGCRYAQGYYFYKPMQASAFAELLIEDNADYRGFLFKKNEQMHVREFLDENTFTDTVLNNLLGAVAFYALDGKDLTITRFNQQFFAAIGDPSMESRQDKIQHYVVREDWPILYRALEDAYENIGSGGICEIRFYKSDSSIFWFRMHFYFLKMERTRRIYYGQVEDVTEMHNQGLQFFEVLRERSLGAMRLNLVQNTIQYLTSAKTIEQIGLPTMNLEQSMRLTAEKRIEDEAQRRKFLEFFRADRLREAHEKAHYHESIIVPFRLEDTYENVIFSTYYIRHSKDQDLMVYVFVERVRDER